MTDDLLEWDYGIYEGRRTGAIQVEQPGWSIWTTTIPEGETVEQVGERVRRVIDRGPSARPATSPCSPTPTCCASSPRAGSACRRGGRLFALGTAAISVLGHEHETRVISVWNQDWHLAPERNP